MGYFFFFFFLAYKHYGVIWLVSGANSSSLNLIILLFFFFMITTTHSLTHSRTCPALTLPKLSNAYATAVVNSAQVRRHCIQPSLSRFASSFQVSAVVVSAILELIHFPVPTAVVCVVAASIFVRHHRPHRLISNLHTSHSNFKWCMKGTILL